MPKTSGASVPAYIDLMPTTNYSFSVDSATGGWTDSGIIVNDLTVSVEIITTGSVIFAPGSQYALPEGAYPPDFPSSHAFSPDDVLSFPWAFGDCAVVNTCPVCLSAILYPVGSTPAFVTGYSGLRVNRDTTFLKSALVAAGMSDPTKDYKLWFVFNDGIGGDFTDNVGSFSVTALQNSYFVDNQVHHLPVLGVKSY